jgi:signal recognition particle subunit SRP54
MVLDKLSNSLKKTFRKVATTLSTDKSVIDEAIKDFQRALIQSDVNVNLVLELSKSIKERVYSEKQSSKIDRTEQVVSIFYDELVKILGDKSQLNYDQKPLKIMLVGLFGNGKTTTAGKLGYFFKKKGFKVAMIQTDTYRPAAYEQLSQLGKKVHIPVFGNPKQKDATKIYKEFQEDLKNYEIVIIDTAGRDALSDELVDEISNLSEISEPNETLLVMSAELGQSAQKQAETFTSTCGVTGVVITRLDGTAKGGGALSACHIANSPVKFIGTGEKIDELELFDPKRFVSRLIGYGDLETLMEKIAEEDLVDENMEEKLKSGNLDLLDVYVQIKSMNKLGSFSKIMSFIPGFSSMNIPKEMLQSQEEKTIKWKYALQSMTKEELQNPKLINDTRVERISEGSGIPEKEVNELLKYFKQMKKFFKSFKGNETKMKDVLKKNKSLKGIDLNKIEKMFGGM